MRNKGRNAATMLRLLEHARYEVLPTASTEDKVLTHLPTERTVTVTASPSKGLDATFDLAERLAGHGYTVVPHVAARLVRLSIQKLAAFQINGARGLSRSRRSLPHRVRRQNDGSDCASHNSSDH